MDSQRVIRRSSCCERNNFKVRYLVSFLAFWSLMNLYALRINLSIAMVAMVKTSKHGDGKSLDVCPELAKENNASGGTTKSSNAEFDWDSALQGYLMSAFFYGYFLTPLLAGVIASAYGALWVLGGGVLVTGVFTLLIPVAARWNPWALFAVRVIIGLGSGVGFPCLHTIIGKWIPQKERSFQTTLIYNGVPMGNIVALVYSGLLIKSGFLGGWPSVFYVTGLLTCTWFVFWALLVYESPHDHPFVMKEELETIMGGIMEKPKRAPIPWRAIATSVPFHALCWTHFCFNWGFYTLLTNVPTYLHQVLHLDIKENGVISALPYVVSVLFSSPAGFMVDKLRRSGRIPITTLRKMANSVASFVPGLCLLAVPFLGCREMAIIVLLSLNSGFNGLKISGFEVTHIDMSPEFGGLLMSGTNTVANIGGIIAPMFIGQIQDAFDTMKSWKIIFITTALIYFAGGVIYLVFGSADLQPWDPTFPSTAEQEEGDEDRERPENENTREESGTSAKSSVDNGVSSDSKNSDSSKDEEVSQKA